MLLSQLKLGPGKPLFLWKLLMSLINKQKIGGEEEKEEKEKTLLIEATTFCQQRPRAEHALRSDQNKKIIWQTKLFVSKQ